MPSQMIGKLSFDEELLQKDLNTIAGFPVFEEEYMEFGIGSWKNYSLWNEDGVFQNTQYRDYSKPVEMTELAKKLPYITDFINANFDITHLKMVRSRNLVNGLVIPHKDFVELSQNKTNYLRVFIPLENNENAYHSDESSVFQMQKGEVWQLDASIVHAAANFSTNSRVHICLDFQFSEPDVRPESIFLDKSIAANVVAPTIPLRNRLSDLEKKLNEISQQMTQHNLLETIGELSKLHFQYDVNIVDCYDWLLSIAKKSGCERIVQKCHQVKKYMIEERSLGERFSFQEYA